MKHDTLIESCQKKCECKNVITSDYGVIFLSNYCNNKFVQISESIIGNQMKLGPLREGNEKKSNRQEQKPFRK